ncbi:hypothetical protein [Methylocystis echinoides]|jgi:hypothetical protein|uniref:Uncharacterized protein n=1 Tax=Methylocystis echinoides TaxID=29468 RepID=A0A9W6LQG7_9HYPH|nr:hypothetical protein [Methylocystis echinoides]GLI91417.1 hypothetical protein LMG27198_04090 [Methylocystis echinoides]
MRKLAIAVMLVPLLFCGASLAQERELGNIQRYGGLWRYQKRDWSHVYGYANPGVCWAWNDQRGEWVWTC